MKIIAKSEGKVNRKEREDKMRNIIALIVFAAAILITSASAFAYWRDCGAVVEIKDPMPKTVLANWGTLR